MARLIIEDGVNTGDLFVPDQLFAFGSIVLHANPTSHVDQINSFSPKHQIRFSNLEYIADIRGDLVFVGFAASPGTPRVLHGNCSGAFSQSDLWIGLDPSAGLELGHIHPV